MTASTTPEAASREIHVLHRYWIAADVIRIDFQEELAPIEHFDAQSLPAIRIIAYMSFWYAALFVVVEGWRALRLHDPAVDRLLSSDNVELLRRYRNGVFHFQRKYWDDRMIDFVRGGAASASWVRELHLAIGDVLLERLRPSRAAGDATAS